MKSKLVKESLNEAFNAMDWIEKEIEDTMSAYGLSEVEIDTIMNDPDIPEKIDHLIQQSNSIKDVEMIALKLMQEADDKGLIKNEQTHVVEDFRGDFPGDTPADQGMRAARKESRGADLDEAFELATSALEKLSDISADPQDMANEDVFQQLMTATNEVEVLVDLLDSKLRKSGYDRHA